MNIEPTEMQVIDQPHLSEPHHERVSPPVSPKGSSFLIQLAATTIVQFQNELSLFYNDKFVLLEQANSEYTAGKTDINPSTPTDQALLQQILKQRRSASIASGFTTSKKTVLFFDYSFG